MLELMIAHRTGQQTASISKVASDYHIDTRLRSLRPLFSCVRQKRAQKLRRHLASRVGARCCSGEHHDTNGLSLYLLTLRRGAASLVCNWEER
jgi:hypothetical protein